MVDSSKLHSKGKYTAVNPKYHIPPAFKEKPWSSEASSSVNASSIDQSDLQTPQVLYDLYPKDASASVQTSPSCTLRPDVGTLTSIQSSPSLLSNASVINTKRKKNKQGCFNLSRFGRRPRKQHHIHRTDVIRSNVQSSLGPRPATDDIEVIESHETSINGTLNSSLGHSQKSTLNWRSNIQAESGNIRVAEGYAPIERYGSRERCPSITLNKTDIQVHTSNTKTSLDLDQLACQAARDGDVNFLATLDAEGLERILDEQGNSLAHIASSNGRLECLQVILTLCPRIFSFTNNEGLDVSESAIQNNQPKCLKWLLENVLPNNKGDEFPFRFYESLLVSAVTQGQEACLRVLLDKYASGLTANRSHDSGNNGPVHAAARKGYLNCLQILQEYGYSLSVHNKRGKTPYCLAKEGGHDQCANYLALCDASYCVIHEYAGLRETSNMVLQRLTEFVALFSEADKRNDEQPAEATTGPAAVTTPFDICVPKLRELQLSAEGLSACLSCSQSIPLTTEKYDAQTPSLLLSFLVKEAENRLLDHSSDSSVQNSLNSLTTKVHPGGKRRSASTGLNVGNLLTARQRNPARYNSSPTADNLVKVSETNDFYRFPRASGRLVPDFRL